jgi:hypothetical protein
LGLCLPGMLRAQKRAPEFDLPVELAVASSERLSDFAARVVLYGRPIWNLWSLFLWHAITPLLVACNHFVSWKCLALSG